MKKIFIFLLLAACVYGLLLGRPSIYFKHSVTYKNFTLRAHGALPETPGPVLDSAIERLEASELYKEDANFDIYLPSSRAEFAFFTPFQSGDYSRVNPFSGNIFIAAADFKADEARTAPGEPAPRMLAAEIASASVRELARRLFRPLEYIFREDWEIRGYCSFISNVNSKFNPPDICQAGADPALTDYKYGLMVDRVMKVEQLTFKELLDREYSRDHAEEITKKFYCGGQ
jgi:hypothetical protein